MAKRALRRGEVLVSNGSDVKRVEIKKRKFLM
jgi:hypothetical protein